MTNKAWRLKNPDKVKRDNINYRKKHKKEMNESSKKYYQEHKEKIKEYGKEYYLKNRTKLLNGVKKRYEKNKGINGGALKEHSREYYKKNKNKINKICRGYYLNNKNKIKQNSTRYYEEHKDEVAIRGKRYRENNKDKLRINSRQSNSKRRVRITGFIGNKGITKKTLRKVWDRDGVNCTYCKKFTNPHLPPNHTNLTTYDHIIPIASLNYKVHLFNPNGILNIVLACYSCNSSKNKSDVLIWCKKSKIEIPKIIIELLNKQKEQTTLGGLN